MPLSYFSDSTFLFPSYFTCEGFFFFFLNSESSGPNDGRAVVGVGGVKPKTLGIFVSFPLSEIIVIIIIKKGKGKRKKKMEAKGERERKKER